MKIKRLLSLTFLFIVLRTAVTRNFISFFMQVIIPGKPEQLSDLPAFLIMA